VSQNNQTNAATCSEEKIASRRYETRKQPSGSWAVIDSTTGSVVKEYKLPNHAGTLAAKLNKAAQS
jgi:3-methyladenine DNA glycosylase AlkD